MIIINTCMPRHNAVFNLNLDEETLTLATRLHEEPHATGVERIVDDEKLWTDFKSRLLASKTGRNSYNTQRILSDMINESEDRYRSNSISRRSSLDSSGTSRRSQHFGLVHNKGNVHSNKTSSTPENLYGLVRHSRRSSRGSSSANVNIHANASWQPDLDGPVRTQGSTCRSSDGIAYVPYVQDILKRATSSQQSLSDYVVSFTSKRRSSLADECIEE